MPDYDRREDRYKFVATGGPEAGLTRRRECLFRCTVPIIESRKWRGQTTWVPRPFQGFVPIKGNGWFTLVTPPRGGMPVRCEGD